MTDHEYLPTINVKKTIISVHKYSVGDAATPLTENTVVCS